MLYLAGSVVLWGVSFLATKTALNGGFSPLTVVWLRMAIATLVLIPFWRRLPKPDYRTGDIGWIALVCFLQPGVYYLCENYAIGLTTSSQAGVISAIVPLLVAAGAWLFLHEHISAQTIGGIALSIAGVVALSLGAKAAAQAPNPVLGNTLEVIAMASAAGAMIALKHLLTRYDPWLLTGIQCVAGAVLFLPGALLSHPSTWLAAPPIAWASVAYLGVFVSLAAFGLYGMAAKILPASRASLAINAVPIVALLAGWLVLGESLGLVQVAGCIAIASGVALGQSGGGQKPEVDTGLTEG
jgi:drug/metabolite transporter (DMT)-like permease